MQRRRFVAGCASGIGAVLAGCLGSSAEPLEERPPENRVEDAIRRAIGEANAAAIEIAVAEQAASDPTAVEIDEAALAARIDDAHGALEYAAERRAADELATERAAARDYVAAVEGLLGATTSLVAAGDDLDALEAALDADDVESARGRLDAVQPTIDDAVAAAADAESALEAVDPDALSAYGAQLERLGEGLDDLAALADGAEHLTRGYDDVLAGREHLEDGQAALERGDAGEAEDEFREADERFADAGATFEAGSEAAGTDLEAEFEVATCRAAHLQTAAAHFTSAAEAADDGDLGTAEEERQAGEDELDRVADC